MLDALQLGAPYPFSRFAPERTQFENVVEEYRKNEFTTIELLFLGCTLGVPKPGPRLFYPSLEQATAVAELLTGFSISIHGPYTISLTAPEQQQRKTTKTHISMNLKLGDALGATHVTFHAGTRKHQSDEQVHEFFKEIVQEKEQKGYQTRLAPEVAGKVRSYAGFQKIVELAHECGTLFCWDFSHDFARGGEVTTESGILKRLELIETNIEFRGYRLPIHISGMIGGRLGEVSHTFLGEGSGVPWRLFFSVLREQGWLNRVQIICESKGEDKSGIAARFKDVRKIKEFIEAGKIVKEHSPHKSRLDAYWS